MAQLHFNPLHSKVHTNLFFLSRIVWFTSTCLLPFVIALQIFSSLLAASYLVPSYLLFKIPPFSAIDSIICKNCWSHVSCCCLLFFLQERNVKVHSLCCLWMHLQSLHNLLLIYSSLRLLLDCFSSTIIHEQCLIFPVGFTYWWFIVFDELGFLPKYPTALPANVMNLHTDCVNMNLLIHFVTCPHCYKLFLSDLFCSHIIWGSHPY